MADVRVIPATAWVISAGEVVNSDCKKHVVAYVRVSTDSEEQLTSYEAQIDHIAPRVHQRLRGLGIRNRLHGRGHIGHQHQKARRLQQDGC